MNPEQKPSCITLANGTKEWRLGDRLHREDGPAVERLDGTNEWFRHGKRHREDGPAIRHPDGYKEWWLEGRQLAEAEFQVFFDKWRREHEKAAANARRQKEEEARQTKSASALQQRLQTRDKGRFRLG